MLVVEAFQSLHIVPWSYRTRWKNCMHLCHQMQYRVSHIYQEGNNCADKLASFSLSNRSYPWWDLIPYFIRVDFFRNRLGLSKYRFH